MSGTTAGLDGSPAARGGVPSWLPSARAYYNEIDPFAVAWLRALIAEGHIAPGEVDDRSIADVSAGDLAGFTQCHFFAGIGVWSYALRRAGWADTRSVWTGSCPCQPFSDAGSGGGFDDARHLWPDFFRLIRECRPDVCFGEQVASKSGLAWLDLVSADVESEGYAIGAVDTCAAGVGAPHIRQRLYWVADNTLSGRERGTGLRDREPRRFGRNESADNGGARGLADDDKDGREFVGASRLHDRRESGNDSARRVEVGELVNAERAGLEGHGGHGDNCDEPGRLRAFAPRPVAATSAVGVVGDTARRGCGIVGDAAVARRSGHPDSAILTGFWRDAEWIYCRDEKWRSVEPGTFPLAHGAPARVGRLRGYGNAINAEQAAAFIEAYCGIEPSSEATTSEASHPKTAAADVPLSQHGDDNR